MVIASDFLTEYRYKIQAAGSPLVVPSNTGGQRLRRKSSFQITPSYAKFMSEEVLFHGQRVTMGDGMLGVTGNIAGELACNSYTDFFAAAHRGPWAAGATSGAQTNIAATISGNILTLTRAAGSFLTDNFKVGDIVRQTGWTTTATTNNAKNGRILTLTATVMTIADLQGATTPFAAKVAGDSVTVAVTGKKLVMAQTNQTNDLFYMEEWKPDITASKQYLGMGVTSYRIGLQPSGIASIDFGLAGIQPFPSTNTAFFASPASAATNDAMSGPSGKVRVGGVDLGVLTSFDLTVNTGLTPISVVGSRVSPDMIRGSYDISGSFSVYQENMVLEDAFLAATELPVVFYLVQNQTAASPGFAIKLDRTKLTTNTPSTNSNASVRSFNFGGLLLTTGGAGTNNDASTVVIQDTDVP